MTSSLLCARDAFQDYGGRSGGIRAQLEAFQTAIVMEDGEIGERAAGVYSDPQGLQSLANIFSSCHGPGSGTPSLRIRR